MVSSNSAVAYSRTAACPFHRAGHRLRALLRCVAVRPSTRSGGSCRATRVPPRPSAHRAGRVHQRSETSGRRAPRLCRATTRSMPDVRHSHNARPLRAGCAASGSHPLLPVFLAAPAGGSARLLAGLAPRVSTHPGRLAATSTLLEYGCTCVVAFASANTPRAARSPISAISVSPASAMAPKAAVTRSRHPVVSS